MKGITERISRYPIQAFLSPVVWRKGASYLHRALSDKLEARRIYRKKDGIAPKPQCVVFDITARCNLRCKMCFLNETFRKSVSKNELSFEDLQRIIDESDFSHANLIGGEIFLRKDIFDIFNCIKRKGARCDSITTNGTLIDEGKAEQLADLMRDNVLETITFSIDGPEHINNMIRGANVFMKTARGIALLRDSLLKRKVDLTNRLIINSVISADNFDCIDQTVDVANGLGVRRLCITHLAFHTPKDIQDSVRILGKDAEETLQCGLVINVHASPTRQAGQNPAATEVRDGNPTRSEEDKTVDPDILVDRLRNAAIKSKLYKIKTTVRPRIPLESIAEAYSSDYTPSARCLYPFRVVRIGSDGKVYFCPYIQKEMGSLLPGSQGRAASLNDVWNNDIFREYRKSLVARGIFPICKRCCKLELVNQRVR